MGLRHLGNLLMIRLEGERVQSKGRRLVFDFERFLVDPYGDFFPGESIFAKEAPVAKADVAMHVELAHTLRGIEHPQEHLFWVGASQPQKGASNKATLANLDSPTA